MNPIAGFAFFVHILLHGVGVASAQAQGRPTLTGKMYVVYWYKVADDAEHPIADFADEESAKQYVHQLNDRTDFWSGILYGHCKRTSQGGGTACGSQPLPDEIAQWNPESQEFVKKLDSAKRKALKSKKQSVWDAAKRVKNVRDIMTKATPALAAAQFKKVNALIATYNREVAAAQAGGEAEYFGFAPKLQPVSEAAETAADRWLATNSERTALLEQAKQLDAEAARLTQTREALADARQTQEASGAAPEADRAEHVRTYRERLSDFERRKDLFDRKLSANEAQLRAAAAGMRVPKLRLIDSNEEDDDSFIASKGGKTGEVQISLFWNNRNDLDLHVISPSGQEIDYRNRRSRCGGSLDVDMNAGRNVSSRAVENVVWPIGGAPFGRYQVFVVYYSNHGDPDPTNFSVRIRHGDREKTIRGSASKGQGGSIFVGDFTRTADR